MNNPMIDIIAVIIPTPILPFSKYNPLCEMAFQIVKTVIIRKMLHVNPRLKSGAHRKEDPIELFSQFFSHPAQFCTTGYVWSKPAERLPQRTNVSINALIPNNSPGVHKDYLHSGGRRNECTDIESYNEQSPRQRPRGIHCSKLR